MYLHVDKLALLALYVSLEVCNYFMNILLELAFLFFIGAIFGWVLELLFRRFISSANPQRKWINPGFCVGPYLPLYGVGLCVLFLIASLENLNIISNPFLEKAVIIICMSICMTIIEYVSGIISIKLAKVRLWDYTNEWGNIQGIICPKFSLIWALFGGAYYLLIHPHIINALKWFSNNLAFSFVIGLFFGVFIIDIVYSSKLIMKIKKFADDNNVIVKYENLKAHIRSVHDKTANKSNFFLSFKSEIPISEHLKEIRESLEKRKNKIKK